MQIWARLGKRNNTAATTNMLTKLYWRCPYYRYISNKKIRRENSNNKSCMFTVQKKKIFTRSYVDRYLTSTTRKTHIFINAWVECICVFDRILCYYFTPVWSLYILSNRMKSFGLDYFSQWFETFSTNNENVSSTKK